jgi:hypothetical protein
VNLVDPFGLCESPDGLCGPNTVTYPTSGPSAGGVILTAILSGGSSFGGGGISGGGLGPTRFKTAGFNLNPHGGGRSSRQQKQRSCGTGPRIKFSPFGLGVTGFLFIGGFSGSVEGGISIPLSALKGNFRGTQLFASASFTQLLGLGAFVGAGNNYGLGYTNGPVQTGATSFAGGRGGTPSPVIQAGAAWLAGGEGQVDLGTSPGVSGGGGPRAGFGAYAAGGIKHSATAATPELCY